MEPLLRKIIEFVGQRHGVTADTEVSLLLVDDEQMHQMNLQDRGVDRTTDVLSFSMMETTDDQAPNDPSEGLLLGDIVVSLPAARRQAEEFGHSVRRELAFLVVHGMLHLLGFDHCTEEDRKLMRLEEEAILQGFDLTRD